MNNLTGSFNSTILNARDKPIITMMEWIRCYIMSRFTNLRENLQKYSRNVMPKPSKILDIEVDESGKWIVVWTKEAKFEVTQGFTMQKFMEDLNSHKEQREKINI